MSSDYSDLLSRYAQPATPAAGDDDNDPDFDRVYHATFGVESGGEKDPSRAVNKDTHAVGATQMLPENVRRWSKQYLGREYSPDEISGDLDAQQKITRGELGRYWKMTAADSPDFETHARRTINKWYSGEHDDNWQDKRPQGDKGQYPSRWDHGSKAMALINGAGTPTPVSVSAPAPQTGGYDDLLGGLVPRTKATAPTGEKFTVTSELGTRKDPFTGKPREHTGVDLRAAMGSPVAADYDGVVEFAGENKGYGKEVVIRHPDGSTTRLGHASELMVQAGQTVKAGDVVAKAGSTGRSTGAHVHWEMRDPSGKVVDPRKYQFGDAPPRNPDDNPSGPTGFDDLFEGYNGPAPTPQNDAAPTVQHGASGPGAVSPAPVAGSSTPAAGATAIPYAAPPPPPEPGVIAPAISTAGKTRPRVRGPFPGRGAQPNQAPAPTGPAVGNTPMAGPNDPRTPQPWEDASAPAAPIAPDGQPIDPTKPQTYTPKLGTPPAAPEVPKIPTPEEMAAAPAAAGEGRVNFKLGDVDYQNIPESAARNLEATLQSFGQLYEAYKTNVAHYNADIEAHNAELKQQAASGQMVRAPGQPGPSGDVELGVTIDKSGRVLGGGGYDDRAHSPMTPGPGTFSVLSWDPNTQEMTPIRHGFTSKEEAETFRQGSPDKAKLYVVEAPTEAQEATDAENQKKYLEALGNQRGAEYDQYQAGLEAGDRGYADGMVSAKTKDGGRWVSVPAFSLKAYQDEAARRYYGMSDQEIAEYQQDRGRHPFEVVRGDTGQVVRSEQDWQDWINVLKDAQRQMPADAEHTYFDQRGNLLTFVPAENQKDDPVRAWVKGRREQAEMSADTREDPFATTHGLAMPEGLGDRVRRFDAAEDRRAMAGMYDAANRQTAEKGPVDTPSDTTPLRGDTWRTIAGLPGPGKYVAEALQQPEARVALEGVRGYVGGRTLGVSDHLLPEVPTAYEMGVRQTPQQAHEEELSRTIVGEGLRLVGGLQSQTAITKMIVTRVPAIVESTAPTVAKYLASRPKVASAVYGALANGVPFAAPTALAPMRPGETGVDRLESVGSSFLGGALGGAVDSRLPARLPVWARSPISAAVNATTNQMGEMAFGREFNPEQMAHDFVMMTALSAGMHQVHDDMVLTTGRRHVRVTEDGTFTDISERDARKLGNDGRVVVPISDMQYRRLMMGAEGDRAHMQAMFTESWAAGLASHQAVEETKNDPRLIALDLHGRPAATRAEAQRDEELERTAAMGHSIELSDADANKFGAAVDGTTPHDRHLDRRARQEEDDFAERHPLVGITDPEGRTGVVSSDGEFYPVTKEEFDTLELPEDRKTTLEKDEWDAYFGDNPDTGAQDDYRSMLAADELKHGTETAPKTDRERLEALVNESTQSIEADERSHESAIEKYGEGSKPALNAARRLAYHRRALEARTETLGELGPDETRTDTETPADIGETPADSGVTEPTPDVETPGTTETGDRHKEPWEMSREEFANEAWYHGANTEEAERLKGQGHLGGSSGYVTIDPTVAARFPGSGGVAGRVAPGEIIVTLGGRQAKKNPRTELHGTVFENISPISGQREEAAGRPERAITLSGAGEKESLPVVTSIPREAAADPHRYLVERALAEGKTVPPEVLAEYPDLVRGDLRKTPETGKRERRENPDRTPRKKFEDMSREELLELVQTDTLTGAGSRLALDHAIADAESDPNTSVVVFDGDNFGKANKLEGQERGDDLIRQIVDATNQSATEHGLDPKKTVFRRGGDEVVVLAPKHLADSIRARAEDVFGSHRVEGKDPTTRAQSSADITLTGTVGDTFAEADQILQDAKNAKKGKGGIVSADFPLDQLHVDPDRFQFKLKRKGKFGGSGSLDGVEMWDKDSPDRFQVWEDPKDGKVYVVNGHNRYDLAQRAPNKPSHVKVDFIDEPTAELARARGALTNIQQGNGDAADVAKFLRDTGAKPEVLAAQGINMRTKLVTEGIGLSRLNDFLWHQVLRGDLPEDIGAIIGRHIENHDLQDQAFKIISNTPKMTKELANEIAEGIEHGPTKQNTTATLFGDQVTTESLILERARVAAHIKSELGTERAAFGGAIRHSDRLEEAGSKIDVKEAQRRADEAANARAVFDKLKNTSGQVSDILDDAARRLSNGEKPEKVYTEALDGVRKAVSEALGRGPGKDGVEDGQGVRPGDTAPDDGPGLFGEAEPVTPAPADEPAETPAVPEPEKTPELSPEPEPQTPTSTSARPEPKPATAADSISDTLPRAREAGGLQLVRRTPEGQYELRQGYKPATVTEQSAKIQKFVENHKDAMAAVDADGKVVWRSKTFGAEKPAENPPAPAPTAADTSAPTSSPEGAARIERLREAVRKSNRPGVWAVVHELQTEGKTAEQIEHLIMGGPVFQHISFGTNERPKAEGGGFVRVLQGLGKDLPLGPVYPPPAQQFKDALQKNANLEKSIAALRAEGFTDEAINALAEEVIAKQDSPFVKKNLRARALGGTPPADEGTATPEAMSDKTDKTAQLVTPLKSKKHYKDDPVYKALAKEVKTVGGHWEIVRVFPTDKSGPFLAISSQGDAKLKAPEHWKQIPNPNGYDRVYLPGPKVEATPEIPQTSELEPRRPLRAGDRVILEDGREGYVRHVSNTRATVVDPNDHGKQLSYEGVDDPRIKLLEPEAESKPGIPQTDVDPKSIERDKEKGTIGLGFRKEPAPVASFDEFKENVLNTRGYLTRAQATVLAEALSPHKAVQDPFIERAEHGGVGVNFRSAVGDELAMPSNKKTLDAALMEAYKFTRNGRPASVDVGARRLTNKIAELQRAFHHNDLAGPGLVRDPHVELLGGELGDDAAELARAALADTFHGGLRVGKAIVLPATSERASDLVAIQVEGPDLDAIRKKVAKATGAELPASFKPVIPVAYVKPGKGEHYADMLRVSLSGRGFKFGDVRVTDRTGRETRVPLRAPAPDDATQTALPINPGQPPIKAGETLVAEDGAHWSVSRVSGSTVYGHRADAGPAAETKLGLDFGRGLEGYTRPALVSEDGPKLTVPQTYALIDRWKKSGKALADFIRFGDRQPVTGEDAIFMHAFMHRTGAARGLTEDEAIFKAREDVARIMAGERPEADYEPADEAPAVPEPREPAHLSFDEFRKGVMSGEFDPDPLPGQTRLSALVKMMANENGHNLEITKRDFERGLREAHDYSIAMASIGPNASKVPAENLRRVKVDRKGLTEALDLASSDNVHQPSRWEENEGYRNAVVDFDFDGDPYVAKMHPGRKEWDIFREREQDGHPITRIPLQDARFGHTEEPEGPRPLEQPETEKPAKTGKEVPPSRRLTNAIRLNLEEGTKIDNRMLTRLADQAFGGTRAAGAYTVKDAYDALEVAVNEHLEQRAVELLSKPADEALEDIRRSVMSVIPTQTNGDRTKEQEDFQQFSTPPTLAYVAARVAGIQEHDVVLEPSAGTGSLAVWAKGVGARVYTNELSDRRRALLEDQGYATSDVDAEFVNDLLPEHIRPSLVIMNPPFSATAGRTENNNTKYGISHVRQALDRLEEGGRLVAIMPEGVGFDKARARGYWESIAKEFTIRANINLPGDEYGKYGTTYPNQIVVIDKTGPTPGADWFEQIQNTVWQKAGSYEEAADALQAIADDRPVVTRKPGRDVAQPGGDTRVTDRGGPDEGAGGSNVPGTRGTTGVPGKPGGSSGPEGGRPGVPPSGTTDQPPTTPDGGRVPDSGGSAPVDSGRKVTPAFRAGVVEAFNKTSATFGSAGSFAADGYGKMVPFKYRGEDLIARQHTASGRWDLFEHGDQNTQPFMTMDGAKRDVDVPAPAPEPTISSDALGAGDNTKADRQAEASGTFVSYVPTQIKGGKPHPANLVESASMAAIEAPSVKYTPKLPKSIIDNGVLSNVQLERVVYAGQRHDIRLPNGARGGFFVGDGTGVGKGRILSGIISDNWNQGRKRSVWLSVNYDLVSSTARDMKALGGNIPLHTMNEQGYEDLDVGDGVLFSSYSSLIAKNKDGKSRLDQIMKWLGPDGVIVFDEAHKAKNALAGGAGQPTLTGQAVIDIQSKLPEARVVYASATGATDVRNMAYMTRLGLWGPGTQFPGGFIEFLNNIESGGVASMEMVARDMKALGMYGSASISFEGVDYRESVHPLTAGQVDAYDKSATAWQNVMERIEDAIGLTNADQRARTKAMTAFWGDHQRFFRQIITAMKVPTAIARIDAALEAGNSVVVSLIGTAEARTKDLVTRATAAGTSLDDLNFAPVETIKALVTRAFPTEMYVDSTDPVTKQTVKKPLLDKDGNQVHNKKAVEMRDKILADLDDLVLPESPLDQLITHYGADKVAELTGRKKRLIFDPVSGQRKYVPRLSGVPSHLYNENEMQAFQKGTKRIAIISDAASTGISLHADKSAENQQRRTHITLELGWSADKQMQTFGRTHRSNQVSAPEYDLISSDLGGEKRFSATIARRLASLGALTKGQRDAAGGGDTLAKYDFESIYGEAAVQSTYRWLERNQGGRAILRKMGLVKRDDPGGVKQSDLTDVPRFLNRILSLEKEHQNRVFDRFMEFFGQTVERAKDNGTFEEGVTDLDGYDFKLKDKPNIVSEDPQTGAKTSHYVITAKEKLNPVPFDAAMKYREQQGEGKKGKEKTEATPQFYRQKNSGKIILAELAGSTTDAATGQPINRYWKHGPDGARAGILDGKELEAKYELITPEDAKGPWTDRFKQNPGFREREHHILGGALLPIWGRLKSDKNEQLKIVRIQMPDGQRIVGVKIPTNEVRRTLRSIGIRTESRSGSEVFTALMENGENIALTNRLRLVPTRHKGDRAIFIEGGDPYVGRELTRLGAMSEKVGWDYKYMVPNDPEKGPAILDRILKQYPELSDSEPVAGKGSGAFDAPETAKGDEYPEDLGGVEAFDAPADQDSQLRIGRGGRIKVAPLPGGSGKKLKAIVLDFSKELGTKIEFGKTRRGTAGTYYPGSAATVVKYEGDLDVTAHEAAHSLDDQFSLVGSWAGNRQRSPFDRELIPAFSQYGSSARSGPRAKLAYRRAEGVAEWIRAYVVNPDAAKNAAPLFHAHFMKTVSPEALEAIHNFSDDFRKWAGQTATERTLSNVRTDFDSPTTLDRLRAANDDRSGTWDRFRASVEDSLAPIWRARAEAMNIRGINELLPEHDPKVLMRAIAGVGDKVETIIERGLVDDKNALLQDGPTGRAMNAEWLLDWADRSSVDSIKSDAKDVIALMVAQRTLELAGRFRRDRVSGIGGGVYRDVDTARRTILELQADPDRYQALTEGARRYRTYADNVLQYLVAKGRMTREAYNLIKKKNQYYVAFNRVMRDMEAYGSPYAPVSKRLATAADVVKRVKGSTRQIDNPFVSLLDNASRVIREADRNTALKAFRDLLATDRGMYEGKPMPLAGIGRRAIAGEANTIRVWVNGAVEHWKFAPDVYNALKGWGEVSNQNMIAKVLQIPGKVMRAGVVFNPGFMVRNPIRDAFHRSLVSRVGSKPWDIFRPKGAGTADSYHLAGGGQAGHYLNSHEDYYAHLDKTISKLAGEKQSVFMIPGRILGAYKALGASSEMVGRLTEYNKAYRHAVDRLGYDDYNAELYAASQARDLLDYAVAGTFVKEFNRYVPFTNAAVQGLVKTARSFHENPKAFMARWAAYVLAPTLMTYAFNASQGKDTEEEYRNMAPYLRDMFWNFKVGPDMWVRIPKPFEAGVLATGIERTIDRARGNHRAFDGYAGDVARATMPVDETAMLGPFKGIIEDWTNFDTFRNRTIIPPRENDLDVELRKGTKNGSRLGQFLQKYLGADSRKIDHFISTQFGGVGQTIEDLSDVPGNAKKLRRFAMDASGILVPGPGFVSPDVQFVLEKSRARDEGNTKAVKDLYLWLDRAQAATSSADKDKLNRIVRQKAARLREFYETRKTFRMGGEIMPASQRRARAEEAAED